MASERDIPVVLAAAVFLTVVSPAAAFDYDGWQKGPWEKADKSDGITIFTNDESPTGVKAFRADVVIDAPPAEVFAVVLDHDRARSRSFVVDYDVLKDDGEKTLVYQKIRRSGLGEREFTARGEIFRPSKRKGTNGPYGFSWTLANDAGPDDPDVDSVDFSEGSFVLTPVDGGERTRVSYRVLLDPGTWLPGFVLNRALRNAAREVAQKLRADAS